MLITIILAYLIGLGVAIRIFDLEQGLGDVSPTDILVCLLYPIWIVPYVAYKISKKIIK